MGFIWFWLVAVMIVAYVVLDGFDLGVGILHPFVARTDKRTPRQPPLHRARCGTATKSGFSPAAARCSSPSRSSTPRPSAASIFP